MSLSLPVLDEAGPVREATGSLLNAFRGVVNTADEVAATWNGLGVAYSAPEAPVVLAAMAGPADSPNDFPDDDAPAWPAMHGFRMRVWLAEPADPDRGPQRGGAHETVRWVTWDGLGALPWLEADLPILAAIRATAAPPPRDGRPL